MLVRSDFSSLNTIIQCFSIYVSYFKVMYTLVNKSLQKHMQMYLIYLCFFNLFFTQPFGITSSYIIIITLSAHTNTGICSSYNDSVKICS